MLNRIGIIKHQTKFSSEPHLVITIDDVPFDEFLVNKLGNDDFIGLVPSISWLNDDSEREEAIDRVLRLDNEVKIAPLLVCPDDQDFSCTLVVAEVNSCESTVTWNRLGLDASPNTWPFKFGVETDWFKEISKLTFDKQEYLDCWGKIKSEEW